MPCHDNQVTTYWGEYANAEKELCEARWIIKQLMDGKKVGNNLLRKHMDEQIKHRRKDRDGVANSVYNKLRRLEDDKEKILKCGGELGQKIATKEFHLKAESERLKAITDEELLDTYWGKCCLLPKEDVAKVLDD